MQTTLTRSRCLEHDQMEPCTVCAADRQNTSLLALNLQRPPITFSDRDMWIAIRSGVLGIVKAIEDHGEKGPLSVGIRASLLTIADAIARRWNIKPKKKSH